MPWPKKLFLIFLGYLLVAGVVFGPFVNSPFLMDDEIQILNSPSIQTLRNWPSFFTSSTMDTGGHGGLGGIYFKPLMTLYYAVAWHMGGASAWVFRAPLLLMHTASSFLVCLLLLEFFSLAAAAGAGLLFLVHPINCEVVAYIADAQDVLYFFWGMIALCLAQRLRHPGALFLGLFAALSFALLSKETGALFLIFVPAYLFLFRRPLWWVGALSAVPIGIGYALWRKAIGLTEVRNQVLHIAQATFGQRLLSFPVSLWHYVEVALFPYRVSTVTDFVVAEPSWKDFWLPLAALTVFLGALIQLGPRIRSGGVSTQRQLTFVALVFAAWLALHGNILFPLDGSYADRWFYVAAPAALWLGLFALGPWLSHPRARVVFVVVVIALSARTMARLQDWAHPIELYRREAALHPWDAIMVNNVGVELFRAGDAEGAGPYFDQAIQLNLGWDVAWNNRGAVAQRRGELAQAMQFYGHATSLGAYALAYENYATLLCQYGSREDCRRYLREKALPLFPANQRLIEVAKAVGI